MSEIYVERWLTFTLIDGNCEPAGPKMRHEAVLLCSVLGRDVADPPRIDLSDADVLKIVRDG